MRSVEALAYPARAGVCSGNVSLTNNRGVVVREMYDLSAKESVRVQIRFASGKRTATVRTRPAVKVAVFSRDKAGQATRVRRTLR